MQTSLHKSWSLRARLAALVVGATLVVAAMGLAATWSNARLAKAMVAMQEQRVRPLVKLDALGRGLERQRAAVLATLAATNDLMVDALKAQAARDGIEMPREVARLREAAPSTAEAELLARLGSAIAASQADGLPAVLGHLDKGQFIEADVESQSRYRPQVEAASRMLDEAIAQQVSLSESDYRAADLWVRRQALATIAATIAALVVGLVLASLIARALRKVLGAHEDALVRGARKFAEGRLDHRIAQVGADEGSVAARMNAMSADFSRLVAEVSQTCAAVAQSARRLARGAEALADRTGGQASSLEQTAASMQQLAASVRSNVDAAEGAQALCASASQAATQGHEVTRGAIATLEETARSADRVRDIAGTIDSLAFQTNILALNAAVEAARAGEHGRGFAVVATEVRALSQRCASAARDIRGLVEESAARAVSGAVAAQAAGKSMEGVERSSQEVVQRMGEIVEASRGQAGGIREVNRAVERLESATQENAHLSGQVARDAAELEQHSAALVAAISRFSIGSAAPAGDASGVGADLAQRAAQRPRIRAVERKRGEVLDAAA